MRLPLLLLPLLFPSSAATAALPFLRAGGKPADVAVFARSERVRIAAPSWRITDARGKTIASGRAKGALPTGRYGSFRLQLPGAKPVSYAVIPDAGKPDPSSPFGMGGYLSMRFAPGELPRAATLLRRMSAVASRDELRWDLVEPQPGHWDFAAFDRGMVAQHDHGIEPLGLLDYWGAYVKDRPSRTSGLPAFSTEANAAFARYCATMVCRYKPGGLLAKKMGWKDGWGVRHWEVWNEPATFWSGTPEQFGALLKAAHAAIKVEQPNAIVHFSNIGPEWDAKAIHVAGMRSFEGLTPHYYSPPRSPDDARMDVQMRETVQWYRKRGLKRNFWVSEVGWDTNRLPPQEARQAQYLVRAYAMALDAGMDRVFWYNFRNDGPEGANGLALWFGVVNRDFTPKVSYAAYAAMASQLRGLKPAGHANLGSDAKGILFSAKTGATAVLWADKQHATIAPIPGIAWRDTFGNPGAGSVPLNDWPVYVTAKGKTAAWLKGRLEAAQLRGIPPVRLEARQILHRAGKASLLVHLTNQSNRAASVKLSETTADRSPFTTPAIPLRSGESREVQLPVPESEPVGITAMRHIALKMDERIGKAERVEEFAGPVVDPVIPHSEREAPTEEQFWAVAPYVNLDEPFQVVGLVPWSPKDLSAKVQVQYDETGLLFRFQVTDDVFHQTHTDANIWEDDSVQIAVQAGRGKAVTMNEFGYALTPQGPKAFRYGGTGGAGDIDARHEGSLTVYNIRIPWAMLPPLKGNAGETFRMDFMVNDNDGYGRRGWLEFTPGIGTGNDPARWVEWTLEKMRVMNDE